MNIDLTFPQDYVVEEISDLPGGPPSRMFYMPSGSQTSGRDGICLKISPRKGVPWYGMFAFNVLGSGEMISGVYGCPGGESLFVASRGVGYTVRADDPSKCEVGPIEPILGVRVLEEARLLIFWDFIAIAAWGSAGLAWKTKRVCIDDLQVEEIASGLIKGSGWDPVNNNRSKFEVELHTGEILSRTGAILQFPRNS